MLAPRLLAGGWDRGTASGGPYMRWKDERRSENVEAVSYTHLTLPTSDLV